MFVCVCVCDHIIVVMMMMMMINNIEKKNPENVKKEREK